MVRKIHYTNIFFALIGPKLQGQTKTETIQVKGTEQLMRASCETDLDAFDSLYV